MNKKTLALYSISLVIFTAIFTHAFTVTAGNRNFGNARLTQVYEMLRANYFEELDYDALIEGAIRGMVESLGDSHTIFMNSDENRRFRESLSGSFSGVGLVLGNNPNDDHVTVVSPIAGTPADRAGITTGDRIIAVDGEIVSASQLEQATRMIRGPVGTVVTLTIIRASGGAPIDIEITREQIQIDSVHSEKIGEIALIRIAVFEERTVAEFEEHLTTLLNQNPRGLILDLRGNPGGVMDAATEIADMFLPEGQTIVKVEDRHGIGETIKATAGQIDIPMVVLVDGGSASASEIIAGAMKDNERATIVGTTTFGKGLIQGVYPLSSGASVKMTVARYLTPNGINIDQLGIEPNIVIESPQAQLREALRILNL